MPQTLSSRLRLKFLVRALAIGCLAGCASAPAALAAEVDLRAPLHVPAVGSDIPRDIVRIAQAEFLKGIRETPTGSDNSRRIARYRGAMIPRATRPAAWCAYFTSWVTRTAGVPIGRRGAGIASAAGIRQWAQRTDRWRHLPRPGDLAVYAGHVGIVTAVYGSRMTTVEGNWSNRVSRLSRSRGEAVGFARVAVGDHRTGR